MYPGSPTSHSWKELGSRHAALINTEKGKVQPLTLGTFYRQKLEKTVKPGEEKDVMDAVQNWIKERANDNCELKIIPKGHINIEEVSFKEKLEALKNCAQSANLEISHRHYQSVKKVLTHPLFQRFKEKLMAREEVSNKDIVQEKVIEAMSRLIADGEIRV